jgi:GNAT superfamily N-acetyltransferase
MPRTTRTSPKAPPVPARLEIRPLTAERWDDFQKLFGENGACGGCWCTWWRQTRSQYRLNSGERNRLAMKAMVQGGTVPGLLAYAGGEAVGWVALQPRSEYLALSRSRTLAPVDDAPVWSVTCFFVAKGWRGRGVMRQLVDAAVQAARREGARLIEAYPVDSPKKLPAPFVYTGVPAVFHDAGFEEVARRSRTRPIVRRALGRRRASAEAAAAPRRKSLPAGAGATAASGGRRKTPARRAPR